MFRKFLAAALCFSALFYGETTSEEAPSDEECPEGPKHMRTSVRYTSSKGIGYNKGYTTIEGFFSPPNILADAWGPFLDLRGHVFDNGRFAANAGLGLR